MYTHYSLYEWGKPIREVTRLPRGGLHAVLKKLAPSKGEPDLHVGLGFLHPRARQFSFRLGEGRWLVILHSPEMLRKRP